MEYKLDILTESDMEMKHTSLAYKLHEEFFPMHLTPFQLQHFHRMPLSKTLLEQFIGKRVIINTSNNFHNVSYNMY